jgi:hypothetical protein
VFAVCKGHLQCERDNRSLSCRTFPFEPYLDHDDAFVGIVLSRDFAGLCPLITGDHAFRPDFIAQCCAMWREMFAADADERAFYAGCSRTLRRQYGRDGSPIPVFHEGGITAFPTSRRRR